MQSLEVLDMAHSWRRKHNNTIQAQKSHLLFTSTRLPTMPAMPTVPALPANTEAQRATQQVAHELGMILSAELLLP